MKATLLALALVLAATPLVALAPAADAWSTCNGLREGCPGTFCLGQGSSVHTEADCNVVFVPHLP